MDVTEFRSTPLCLCTVSMGNHWIKIGIFLLYWVGIQMQISGEDQTFWEFGEEDFESLFDVFVWRGVVEMGQKLEKLTWVFGESFTEECC
ncbi:hypothetical protein CEXT_406261 [Caerostris extrusa]|uniref:Uncharacterized protein n=1 Tax=Caerostris extrusa TaxID=172846 RepID=A0AAV4VLE6_CAEEX|nr:hypothetical protein CEXT_406261 [Caerostris extrusa]